MIKTVTSLALLGVAAMAVACSERETTVLIPTTPSAVGRTTPATPTTTTSSLVGRWVSVNAYNPASARLPNGVATCGSVVMNVASQTATQISGVLSMSCPPDLTVSGNVIGQLGGGATIPLTWQGTSTNSAGESCQFQLSGTVASLGNDYYHFDYTGNSTCQGTFVGSETLHVGPANTSTPTPTPTPAGDMIPFGSAVIHASPLNLPSWPITSALRVVEMTSAGIHVEFSKQDGPGRWPDVVPPGWDGPLQYTLGMALNINGQWHAAAPVQFWYGLSRSGGPPSQYALNWFYDPGRWAPMTYHQPAVGETIGIFACAGNCRNVVDGSQSPVKERTNVVTVTMPTDAGARFTF